MPIGKPIASGGINQSKACQKSRAKNDLGPGANAVIVIPTRPRTVTDANEETLIVDLRRDGSSSRTQSSIASLVLRVADCSVMRARRKAPEDVSTAGND